MYSPGSILFFTPFQFKNGREPKNKYFIVLSVDADRKVVVASLPTSKDHIPRTLPKEHGCINSAQMNVSCYFFERGRIIAQNGEFSFPRDTYVYGEQVDTIDLGILERDYQPQINYFKVCDLSQSEFNSLKTCLKESPTIKNKIKRYL